VGSCPALLRRDKTKLSSQGSARPGRCGRAGRLAMSGMSTAAALIRITLHRVPRRARPGPPRHRSSPVVVMPRGPSPCSDRAGRPLHLAQQRLTRPQRASLALSLGDGPTLRAEAGSVCYLAMIWAVKPGARTNALRDSGAPSGLLGMLTSCDPHRPGEPGPDWEHSLPALRADDAPAGLAIQASREFKTLPIRAVAGLGRAGRLGRRGDAGRAPVRYARR